MSATSMLDFRGKRILVTGGTSGIGLETALLFARGGARCVLTYRLGSADEGDVLGRFASIGAPAPLLVQADVVEPADTAALLEAIDRFCGGVDVFVSNVSGTAVIQDVEDYELRTFKKTINYSAWPLVDYTLKVKARFGRYPRYVIGVSSTGVDHYTYGYDAIASAKAVMETLCRYMTYRLRDEDVNINVVRSRAVRTQSMQDMFGDELFAFARRFVPDAYWMQPEEVAGTIVALASGWLDGMRGQVITVDRGSSFFDNLMELYSRRHELEGLKG